MERRGRLWIFLGYAAGVGKTYQMLVEAQRLRREGADVVIGYFEPHGRVETIAQTEGLEFVPRAHYQHRGSVFEDMDTEAVIRRKPQVVAVDEFAHSNAPGAPRPKRWQDVMAILDAGIDVLTSMNVQHIESLNDQVLQITHIRVRETVPDWVLHQADEVVVVDVTPRALIHRLERGVVYSPEKAARALQNFFTEANLTALRELSLRRAAQQLNERVTELSGTQPAETDVPPPPRRESILLWLTPNPSTAVLIRRGRRVADYLSCPCTAVYCARDEACIEPWLNICRNLRIDAERIPDQRKVSAAVAAYARSNGTTQIFVTRDTPGLTHMIHLVRDIQVTVVAAYGAETTHTLSG
jgi:two-component system sensor histidine kinase KdpD